MGCGCGTKTQKMTYTYVAPNGARNTGLSEAQARAMQIRNGGTYKKE